MGRRVDRVEEDAVLLRASYTADGRRGCASDQVARRCGVQPRLGSIRGHEGDSICLCGKRQTNGDMKWVDPRERAGLPLDVTPRLEGGGVDDYETLTRIRIAR